MVPVSATRKCGEHAVDDGNAGGNAGQRKVDRAANARLPIAGARVRRLLRYVHGCDDLACGKRQVSGAVIGVEIAQGHAPGAARPGDLDFCVEDQQRRREIAGERRVTVIALRRDVAGLAAVLEAVVVRPPPPFALVVEHATGVEAEISADGGDVTVRRRCNAIRRLDENRQRAPDAGIRGEPRQRDAGADHRAAVGHRDAIESGDAAKIDQRSGFAESVAQVRQQIRAAGQQSRARRRTRATALLPQASPGARA